MNRSRRNRRSDPERCTRQRSHPEKMIVNSGLKNLELTPECSVKTVMLVKPENGISQERVEND
ncbi:Hypothetical protein CINCED_3A003991, partial [Cinara cedri]